MLWDNLRWKKQWGGAFPACGPLCEQEKDCGGISLSLLPLSFLLTPAQCLLRLSLVCLVGPETGIYASSVIRVAGLDLSEERCSFPIR